MSAAPAVSVCVPARDEARTIGPMLASVLAQEPEVDLELVVCANGCTDGTEEAARTAARGRDVRILATPERGKANAWNLLFRAARHELIAFADADVRLRPGALAALARRIRRPDAMVAVGALTVPCHAGCDPLTRVLGPAPRSHGCLVGRLYMVHRGRLESRLRAEGFERMPRAVMHDDAWVTIVAGRGRWTTEPAAQVEYRPAHWSELLAVERRLVRADRQLVRDFGELLARDRDEELWLHESPARRRARRLRRWREANGLGARIGIVVNFLAKRMIRFVAERQVDRSPDPAGEFRWSRSEHSRRWPSASR